MTVRKPKAKALTDADLLIVDLFGGDETDVKMERKSIVTVKKERRCLGCKAHIKPGQRARIDRWFDNEDRAWQEAAHCIPCVTEEF